MLQKVTFKPISSQSLFKIKMKNITLKCCLIVVFLPILINAGCSFFEPLEYYDRTKPVKNWYVVRRYANGPESNTTCQILNYPKAPGSRTLYYADGTKLVVTGNGVPPEPGCSSGKLILKDMFPTNRPSVKYVTYTDYETIRVTRACYNDEG